MEWIKIYSFDSQYQAELTKGLLEQNGVKSVVINAKDSLFLIGEYELYVQQEDEKKAGAIVDEYKGLTKIDSFIMRGPVERLKDVLEDADIPSVIKTVKNPRYVLDNYELYVNNEDVQVALPYITGEKLEGWLPVKTCFRTRQARFRVELLNEVQIPCIVVKKRDVNFMKQEINIYVKNEDADKARNTLQELKGWTLIQEFETVNAAEINETHLGKQGLRGIIEKKGGKFALFVEDFNKEEAVLIIEAQKPWKLLETYTDSMEADYAAALLENSGIEAVTVARTDLNLMVDIDLYVEEFKLDEAAEILKNISVTENE
jgi:hypothetical protein